MNKDDPVDPEVEELCDDEDVPNGFESKIEDANCPFNKDDPVDSEVEELCDPESAANTGGAQRVVSLNWTFGGICESRFPVDKEGAEGSPEGLDPNTEVAEKVSKA